MRLRIWDILKNKWFVFLPLSIMMIAGATVTAFAWYVDSVTREVTLRDNGQTVQILTTEETVGALLEKFGIELGPEDEIRPGLADTIQKEGTTIEITRAFQVSVWADGQLTNVYLTDGNVAQVLKKAGVTLRENDLINYGLYERVSPGDFIRVNRLDVNTLFETEHIPYQVVTRKNHDMDEGTERVVQEGKQGELQKKLLATYLDGVETLRRLIDRKVTVEPVDRIIERGTVKTMVTSRGQKIRYWKVEKMSATAYTAGFECTGKNPGDPYYGITKSGKHVQSYHTIAADKSIPFGTKVYIPYMVDFWKKRGVDIDGIFVVEDRGSAIYGNRIDIYIEDKATVDAFGRRNMDVYFLK